MSTTDDTAAQDENRLIAERRAKLEKLRATRNAFPNDFRRDALAGDLQKACVDEDKEALEHAGRRVKVAGRIMRMRGPFLVIDDVSGQIQLYVNREWLDADTLAEMKLLPQPAPGSPLLKPFYNPNRRRDRSVSSE